jgi:hypothetical protein
VTIDTGAFMIRAKPNVMAGLPDRNQAKKYALNTASGEIHHVLKEA